VIVPLPARDQRDDGIPVRGTCGVTFVSPHFAITAAHCVSSQMPITLSTKLRVEHYELDGVSLERIRDQAKVTGTFPNYRTDQLDASEGYRVTANKSCFVRRRCSTASDYGRDNCPFSEDVDIALLECTDRSWSGDYVPVAPSENVGEVVSMYWYHEVLDLPVANPGQASSSATQQRWIHYGALENRKDNHHYLGGGRNQLLPLISSRFDDRATRSLSQQGVNTRTNLGGCHGSSGSGVFRRVNGVLQLLGPVTTGAFEGLCTGIAPRDFEDWQLGYAQARFTRQLAGTEEVRKDIATAISLARLRDAIEGIHFEPPLIFNPPGPDPLP